MTSPVIDAWSDSAVPDPLQGATHLDKKDLALQVVDITFDGKIVNGPLQFTRGDRSTRDENLRTALQNLPAHEEGIARIFDFYGYRYRPFTNKIAAIYDCGFLENPTVNDVRSIAEQWTANGQGIGLGATTVPPHPEDSSPDYYNRTTLSCRCISSKLLGIVDTSTE